MKTKQWLLLPTLVVIGIIVMTYIAYNQLVTSTTLSQKDIESRIAALYGGQVETIQKNGSQYNITFAVDDYIYEVIANEEYGTFRQLTLIKEGTKNETPDDTKQPDETSKPDDAPTPTPEQPIAKPQPAPEPAPTPVQPPAKQERLTEAQVIAIAKRQAAGTVDDIEFYSNNNGGYYIVEIEKDAEDAEDVTLQIHAITGKILSVSFDD